MDRAPSLQDSPSETRAQPAPQGAGIDYKEIAREVLARIDQRLAHLEAAAPSEASEARFYAGTAGDRMSSNERVAFVGRASRRLIGLLLAASLVAATSFLWFRHDAAMRGAAQLVPRIDPAATTLAENPNLGPRAAANATADAAPAPAAPPPRAALDKPVPAPVPPELAELMRKVDRNIAGLAQAVTELRLAHQQATVDNAKAVADIRASLDHMTQAMASATASEAKEAEQLAQAKPAAPPAPPAARRTRRYVAPYMSPNDAMGYMR